MDYYEEIKNKIIDEEIYRNVKDYSKEKHRLITYYEIGKLLNEADIQYGRGIIKQYSEKLTIEFGKKYTPSLLYKIKQFYMIIEKVPTLSGRLTWSHWYEMLSIKDIDKIKYYAHECENQYLDVRTLRYKIKNNEYERLPSEAKSKLICNDKLEVSDLVPNPILIKNKNNLEIVSEKILHQLVLENITNFMKELGNEFNYIDSEYKIKIGDRFNYIDILLFNIKFNSYVVVELKVNEFKVEYISQVQKYMNYIDKNIKEITNNNTIGILICKRENKYMIEYCSDKRIIVREYELV